MWLLRTGGWWRSDIEVDAGVFGVCLGEVGEGGGNELIVDGVLEGSEEGADAAAAGGTAGAAAGFSGGIGGAGDGFERTVDGVDDIGEGDAVGWQGELVATADAAAAAEEAGAAEDEEDLFEEFDGDVFGGGDFVDLRRGVWGSAGHGGEGADGVFGFSGESHGGAGGAELRQKTSRWGHELAWDEVEARH